MDSICNSGLRAHSSTAAGTDHMEVVKNEAVEPVTVMRHQLM